jgi:hypothetical protein
MFFDPSSLLPSFSPLFYLYFLDLVGFICSPISTCLEIKDLIVVVVRTADPLFILGARSSSFASMEFILSRGNRWQM